MNLGKENEEVEFKQSTSEFSRCYESNISYVK